MIPDDEAARLIAPLFRLGREAFAMHHTTLEDEEPVTSRTSVVGEQSMAIVLEADFLANAALCLRHVTRNEQPIHILSEGAVLTALMQSLSRRQS